MKTNTKNTAPKTAYDYGYEFAKWGHGEKIEGFDVTHPLNGDLDIPSDDAHKMSKNGVALSGREYWRGFNAYVAEVA